MFLIFNLSTLPLYIFLALLVLEPYKMADVPYGTRLSSVKQSATSISSTTPSASAKDIKDMDKLTVSSSQIVSLKSAPTSYYEVDLPADDYNEKNSVNSANDLTSANEMINENIRELPPEKAEVEVSISIAQEMPPSESVDSAHFIHPQHSFQPVHHSPVFGTSTKPIQLNLATSQHPGNLDGRRHPFMVDSSNVQAYVRHLPPLTAALPMGHFGDHLNQPNPLNSEEVSAFEVHNSLEDFKGLPKDSTVYSAPLEQPSRESNYLIRVNNATTFSNAGATLDAAAHRAIEAASLSLRIARYAPAYVPGIPGRPWKDYPLFAEVPKTSFSCAHTSYGYYADVESGCQAWYYCQPDGRQNAFLCPNGTVFNQKVRVCDWWYNVHCPNAVRLYNVNADLYKPTSELSISHSVPTTPQPQPRPQPPMLSHLPNQPIRLHIHPRTFFSAPRLITPPSHLRYRAEYELEGNNNGGRHELDSSA